MRGLLCMFTILALGLQMVLVADAGCSFKCSCCFHCDWVCSGGFGYDLWGKRSVDGEILDPEYIDWLRNNATLTDHMGMMDGNCDGCVDTNEWYAHGVVRDFVDALKEYDTNGDDCLSIPEVEMAPFEIGGVEEFMEVPMKMFNDMMMQIEGNNNRGAPKERKKPDEE